MSAYSNLSSLSVNLRINKNNLHQLFNQQVDKVINALPPQQIDRGEIRVQKKGDLKIDMKENVFLLEIPLAFQFKGKKLLSLVEAQAEIELLFRSEVNMQPYWQLTTRTTLDRYNWLEKPDVQLSFLNISVEKMADQLLHKNKALIEQKIDVAITDFWAQAKVAEVAETFFNRSHQLRPGFPLFLRLFPEKIQLAPTASRDGYFFTQLKSDLFIEITSTSKREKLSALPTPSLETLDAGAQSLINVNVLLDYISLEDMMRKQMIGQSFTYKNNTVHFSDFRLSKSEDFLRLEVGLSGYIEGRILMNCLPIYEEESNNITMQIQSFELQANSFWKRNIVNLFSGRIKKEMEKRLQYNLNDIIELEEIKKLKQFQPKPGIDATIDLQSIRLREFIVGPEGLSCFLNVELLLELTILAELGEGLI